MDLRKRGIKQHKAQVSVEYLIVIGFVVFVLIAVLGIAFVYSGTIKTKIKINQLENFANKILSTAESVFYSGEPSKATISVYLSESIKEIEIIPSGLVITIHTSSGINKRVFSSKVPISGTLSSSPGLKTIQIVAESDKVVISHP